MKTDFSPVRESYFLDFKVVTCEQVGMENFLWPDFNFSFCILKSTDPKNQIVWLL